MTENENVDIYVPIRRVLIAGTIGSFALMAIGFAMLVGSSPSLEASQIMPFSKIAGNLAAFDPTAILSLGIVILLLTPLARVFMTSVLFFKQRDFLYVGISAIVIVVLVASLLLGAG